MRETALKHPSADTQVYPVYICDVPVFQFLSADHISVVDTKQQCNLWPGLMKAFTLFEKIYGETGCDTLFFLPKNKYKKRGGSGSHRGSKLCHAIPCTRLSLSCSQLETLSNCVLRFFLKEKIWFGLKWVTSLNNVWNCKQTVNNRTLFYQVSGWYPVMYCSTITLITDNIYDV